jgi:hypothetical protein
MRLRSARVLLKSVVMRASTDSAYLQALQTSPVETLLHEGLPFDLIEDFLQEAQVHPEVSGYLLPGCANTCALTTTEAYPEGFIARLSTS